MCHRHTTSATSVRCLDPNTALSAPRSARCGTRCCVTRTDSSALDSALFLDPAIISPEYVHRCAHDTVFDQADLLAALQVSDADGVENAIDFDGTIELRDRAIELIIDGAGTELHYPFTVTELHELSGELDPG